MTPNGIITTNESRKHRRNTPHAGRIQKAILVVSFGTSFAETREKTIDAIEKRLQTLSLTIRFTAPGPVK